MILLGSVQRFELERIIYVHLSYDQKIVPPGTQDDQSDDDASETSGPNSRVSSRPTSRPTTPPPFIDAQFSNIKAFTPKSRFHVSKVDDIPMGSMNKRKLSLASSVSIIYRFILCLKCFGCSLVWFLAWHLKLWI